MNLCTVFSELNPIPTMRSSSHGYGRVRVMFHRCWVLGMTLNCSHVLTFFLVIQESHCVSFMPNVIVSCTCGFGNVVPLWATVPLIMGDSRVSFVPREVWRVASVSPRRDNTSGIGAKQHVRRCVSPHRDGAMRLVPTKLRAGAWRVSPRRDSETGLVLVYEHDAQECV